MREFAHKTSMGRRGRLIVNLGCTVEGILPCWQESPCLPPTEIYIFFYILTYISKCLKFAFSDQMSLKMIAELLKNAPVLLKRHLSLWLVLSSTVTF